MARRRKADDKALIGLLLVAAAAVAALFGLAIVAPAALFAWWLYCEIRRLLQPRHPPALDVDEQRHLGGLENLLIEYQDSQAAILQIGDESGIPRRGDNLFDGRYGAARNINDQLGRLKSDIDNLQSEISIIRTKIVGRAHNWSRIRNRSVGARLALGAYIILFVIFVQISPSWILAIGQLTDIFGLKLTEHTMILFGCSAASSFGAGITLWLIDSTKGYLDM